MSSDEISKLVEVVAKIRHPKEGCPWDLEQTHKSLLPYLIEESYEYLYAVENLGDEQMCEELGDVLFQVILHAQLAQERGAFNLQKIAEGISQKLIRRHPHVFSPDGQKLTSQEVLVNWEKIKNLEKSQDQNQIIKSTINLELAYRPALQAAQKIGQKSTRVGFDWDTVEQVHAKVEEEWSEFNHEWANRSEKNQGKLREELGDLFFSLAQLSRHLGFNPEEVLRESNQKFIDRFQRMESLANEQRKIFADLSLEEKEKLWSRVKKGEGEK